MLREKIFLVTITRYLKDNAFSSTVSRDLFDQFLDSAVPLGRVARGDKERIDFRAFMEPWTNRSGYPIVYLVRNESDNTVRNNAI